MKRVIEGATHVDLDGNSWIIPQPGRERSEKLNLQNLRGTFMSMTVIESTDALLLTGFMHAILFFTPNSVTYSLDKPPFWLLVTDSPEDDNQTYTLTEDGLVLKHTGVEL